MNIQKDFTDPLTVRHHTTSWATDRARRAYRLWRIFLFLVIILWCVCAGTCLGRFVYSEPNAIVSLISCFGMGLGLCFLLRIKP